MPKAAEYRLTWSSERQVYELREHRSQQLLTITPGSPAWFAWLDSVPSFTFQGQQGQLTVRKESRQRGDRYWYAYRRVGEKMVKKYLGQPGSNMADDERQVGATPHPDEAVPS
jgi:hypothetical protein